MLDECESASLMEGSATHFPPVDGLCPRCGTEVSELSRRCRECLLQLQPGDDISGGQTAMLRRVWEDEHPEATQAFDRWTAAPEGPPPGVTSPVRPPQPAEPPLAEFKPLDSLMMRVIVVLAAVAVLDLVSIIAHAMELSLLSRVDRGESVSLGELESSDTRVALIGLLQVVLYITAAVVFIQWFHRAYQNVGAIRGRKRRFGQGWAIGGWFVPFLNWWRPKQIANDLWAAGGKDASDANPTFLLAAWWGLFLISSVLTRLVTSRWDDEEVGELMELSRIFIAADAVDVIGAILAVLVVRRITERLKARREESVAAPAADQPVRQSFSPPAPEAAPPA